MKNKIKNLKGFTLIEMLIVIVIIGILAAAIIPRLNSARGRANDVARKADLNQVATALITYQIDEGNFPITGSTIDIIQEQLIDGGMTSIPKDPANSTYFSGANIESTGGASYYLYLPIEKNGLDYGGFILMSKMESKGQANYVVCDSDDIINKNDPYNDIKLCSSMSEGSCNNEGDGNCFYNKLSQLRYIYKY